MHDLVHDLATTILADKVNKKGNAVGGSCQYALLTDCSKPLPLSPSSPENSCFKKNFNLFQKRSSPENIKTLFFMDCGKIELRGGAFSPAKCLLVLDLSECFIRKLPGSIGQLKQLRYLHAPRIQDKKIPSCISELSQLNYLNLGDSHYISALPESIGDMKGLMHLDLSGCIGISELPKSFTKLKQLVHLDLSYCKMSISEALFGFTKLQYLNLSVKSSVDTKLVRGLPEVIGNLIKLRYLNLSGCMDVVAPDQINSLVRSISTLSNLEHLDLSKSTELSSIPESIGNLRKLHTLDLSGCYNLKKLPDCMVHMVSLKVLLKEVWPRLDKSMRSQLNFASLPHFEVHACTDKCSSNISLLLHTNPDELTIDRLGNVKSAEEAQSIKLIEKQKIQVLKFQWKLAAERFADDKEVLENLVPPSSVRALHITGYGSVRLPSWVMSIWQYLPNLSQIDLRDFPKCNNLPPLGQLPHLRRLRLCRMDSLEEWNTGYTRSAEGTTELMFPKLEKLSIKQCAKLMMEPCLPRTITLDISDCDSMLSSWGETSSHSSASSSPITDLIVDNSKVPLHPWGLLHHLPVLCSLTITHCSDLTTSPEILQHLYSLESLFLRLGCNDQADLPSWLFELTSLRKLEISHPKLQELNEETMKLTRLQKLVLSQCGSVTSLPQWLGELTSLKKFEIRDCEGIGSLPDSIQQLTKLEYINIRGCPTLIKWCKSRNNKMKLAHIKQKIFQ